MSAVVALAAPWAARRTRAEALGERYRFAREPLLLYRALLEIQERAWTSARSDTPSGPDVPGYVAERVWPGVAEITTAAGPRPLADLVRSQFGGAGPDARAAAIRRWLQNEDQPPVERYLARASAGPVLEALGEGAGEACGRPVSSEAGEARGADERLCPVCGGRPQLSYVAQPAESLATGPRSLLCARCAASWAYPRLTCASCGEQDSSKLTVLAEEGTAELSVSGSAVRGLRGRAEPAGDAAPPRFPHMRIDACTACSRYVLSVDLGRDPRAVPLVDELAAIPLDLYAAESGFIKVVPNLMGA